MQDQEMLAAAREIAGGTAAKLAALIGWSEATIHGWSAKSAAEKRIPPGARVIMTMMIDLPAVREYLLAPRLAATRRPAKKAAK